MSGILRFNINIPEEVALQRDTGRHVQGRYGEQVMYSLADGRVMYVPPYVEQRIIDLAIAPGEPFEICKAEANDGPRRWIEWHVRRTEEPRQPNESPNFPATAAPSSGYPQIHRNGSTNGHTQTRSHVVSSIVYPALPVPADSNGGSTMEVALREAVSIARRVEGEAAESNYCIRFNNEDIRAIGVSLFIQLTREEGFRWQH